MKNNEKGSSTIIVFVTVLFMMVTLGAVMTTLALKNKSQLVELDRLRNAYDGNMAEIYNNYNNV